MGVWRGQHHYATKETSICWVVAPLHQVTDTEPCSRHGCSGRQMCKQLITVARSVPVLFWTGGKIGQNTGLARATPANVNLWIDYPA